MDNQQQPQQPQPPRQQILEHLKAANNVLVAVNSNPTVDELSASVGLTLALNKLGKHATTVFSGVVPSTIEFLQPEKTIETTTDSLRDFIIALDKSKADKLRYKVEDDVVRIFITPYHTTITEGDLAFSHGDFNVDVVVALGVKRQADLDKAITAHGSILHDATVLSLSNQQEGSELGSLGWQEPQASSLCEMVAGIMLDTEQGLLDGQMATAFLTGIIAETDRFKNEKTTPVALSISSQLMSMGANQQLIAEKLEEPPAPLASLQAEDDEQLEGGASDDGTLNISHDEVLEDDEAIANINIDEHGNLDLHEEPDSVASQDFSAEDPSSGIGVQDDILPDDPTPDNPSDDRPAYVGDDNLGLPPEEETPTEQSPAELPMLQHERKVIEPPSGSEVAKTDKPFDLNAALQAANDPVGADAQALPAPPVDMPPVPQPPVSKEEPLAADGPQAQPLLPADQEAAPLEEEASTPAPSSPGPEGQDQTLTQLEQAVDSPHVVNEASPVPMPTVGETPKPSPLVNDPTAPPPVPPPMTTPMFYDSDGNNANPFLNPPGSTPAA